MSEHYPPDFLRMLRNQIPIDEVITDLLNLQVRNVNEILRFRCPLCSSFHTATKQETNLARCFDCQKNFNPIDLVMTVGKCSFVDAVERLKNSIDQ
jgi:DNA primase